MYKSKAYNLIDYLLVILTVLASKTVFFGIIYAKVTIVIFTITCLLIFVLRSSGKFYKKNFISIGVIGIFAFVILGFHSKDVNSSFINIFFITFIPFVQMFLTVSILDKKSFIEKYVNILFVMSLISLVCFFIAVYKPDLASELYKQVNFNNHIYNITPYYTWGWGIHIFERNSGMFWEPGAFQGFLIIAVLFILFFPTNHKIRKAKIIIFFITLLTTGSTTGYLLMILVCLGYYKRLVTVFSGVSIVNRRIKIFTITCLVIAVITYIISSGNIGDKLNENSASSVKRMSDLLYGWIAVFDKPVFGYAFSNERLLREEQLGLVNNSVGLVSMLYTCGIPFGIYYYYLLCRGISIFFDAKRNEYFVLIVIFLILHLTEAIWWLPVYVIFLFIQKDNSMETINNRIDNRN